ncbi:hypothetical protein OGATHE_006580 [Ogataea polymorpha]|uniref:Secreted protein n=1 Tax=Ogataea polymorpha TaxID=460523 RepID=A0A9P8NT00_9ASCO|nr:hypothetical protein OGATHE_006580 [Ogataea polymorpha]
MGVKFIIHLLWVGQCAQIAQTLGLSGTNLTEHSSHDLARPGLWQVWNDDNAFWSSKRPNYASDVHHERFSEGSKRLCVVCLRLVLQLHKCNDGLASDVVVDSNNSGLADMSVFQQNRLDLGSGQSVARNIHNVVDSSSDPIVAIVVSSSTVSREVEPRVRLQIGFHVPVVVFVDGSCERRPAGSDGKHSLDIISFQNFSGNRVDDDGVHAEERQRGCTRLGRNSTCQWCDQVRSRFGLPVRVRDVTQTLTDFLVVPLPDLCRNRLSDRAQSPQR